MHPEPSLSYTSGASDHPLLGLTVGEVLERATRLFPTQDGLIESFSGRRWSFAELSSAVDRLAAGLLQRGVRIGDRVGIWSPNCAEWILVQYATARIGAILVNVNPAYRTHEVEYVIRQSGMRLLISATAFRTTDYAAMLREVGFEHVVFIGSPEWTAMSEACPDEPGRQTSLSFDDPINIQYTSGTTGSPKGATLTHHNIVNNGYFVGEGLALTSADRVCVPVPLYHCFGMVMGVLGAHSHGAAIVLPAPVFDPELTLQAVEHDACTALYGVPTMFIAELALPTFGDYDLSTLRTGIMAGSPCPTEVMERVMAEMHMSEVAICYGMTETSPVSTMTRRDDDIHARTQTIGQVMPHVEIKLIDADGRVVPIGSPGELCTRGYSVMRGYWGDARKTSESIDESKWMRTGDIATMDADRRLRIVGRSKDMVIRGGENIYPREIEEFFHRHPAIADIQVIGVPDAHYGEELMAWIILEHGAPPLTAADLRDFATGRLAHFKIPRYSHVVDAFPMTVTGKVRKVEMREMAVDLLSHVAAPQARVNPVPGRLGVIEAGP